MPPLVSLRGVDKVFHTPAGDFSALRQVDLELPAGELVAVVGASGSGKTTLVHLIAGLDRASRGELVVDGTALNTLDETGLARWRGRRVGVVFQFFQLLPTLTVLENVMLPMDLCGTLAGAPARARAMWLLDSVGVADQADKLPSALSGGQQQRAAIARALANDPPLVLADEPTGNLDTATADRVLGLLGSLVREGKTVVFVTHEPRARASVDRVVTLRDGQVVDVTTSTLAEVAGG
ncbi:MAG: ABC transporter ATP-binding protein [Myxococcota bacterium]